MSALECKAVAISPKVSNNSGAVPTKLAIAIVVKLFALDSAETNALDNELSAALAVKTSAANALDNELSAALAAVSSVPNLLDNELSAALAVETSVFILSPSV